MTSRRIKRNITTNPKKHKENWRFWLFGIVICLSFGVIIARLFQIQVLEHNKYKEAADLRHRSEVKLVGDRGNIYFQNLKSGDKFPVAINLNTYNVGIDASMIDSIDSSDKSNRAQIQEFIEANFPDIDKNRLAEEFDKTDSKYYIFAKDVAETVVYNLKSKKLKGFILEKKSVRSYPEKTLGSQVIGYMDRENIGKYGVEKYYNEQLKGRDGFARIEAKDTRGVWLANTAQEKQDAVNGANITLTIDHTLQYKLEEVLAELASEQKPKVALGVIMNPKTGEILAMASNPSFDPNEYNKIKDMNLFNNPVIANQYDQGSIFKPITVGIGLDAGVITPNTTYEDKGIESINNYQIANWSDKAYGTQTMSYALENSLNLGMIFIQRKLGREAFVSGILDKFQIRNKTGIDLPGEINNNISNLTKSTRDAREIDYANASFGQGISLTPIRMLTSFNSIVNGGKIVRPRIVKSIQNADGEIETFEPEIQGQSMSEEKANQLAKMLVDVVDKGSGKKASVAGYSIGGKTGTGQIAVNGKYEAGGPTYQSFIEFATLENTQYTLLISLDSPQGAKFSDGSVVPKMKALNEFLLNYFAIVPDKPI